MVKYILFFAVLISLAACGQGEQKQSNITIPLAKTEKMDTAFFWKIIDHAFESGKYDNEVKEKAILDQLTSLTPEQIREFEIIFQQMNQKASTWGILAAQTVIEGGSSDDRFFYFRCWLISLGEKNFTETIKNPDHLAALDIPFNKKYGEYYCQFEELIPMADRAYEIVTKKDPSSDTTFPRPYAVTKGLFYDSNTQMKGEEWESNEELPQIVPLLWKKYDGK